MWLRVTAHYKNRVSSGMAGGSASIVAASSKACDIRSWNLIEGK
jgi:hypothetical protein